MTRRNQLWLTAFLASGMIVTIALLKPVETKGLPMEKYWTLKVTNQDTYDLVALGDSRIMNGISPAIMNQILPDLKIMNFSFSGLGYSKTYFDFVKQHIKANGARIAVIGITPTSLRLKSAAKNGFMVYRRLRRSDRFFHLYFSDFLKYFDPVPISRLYQRAMGKKVSHEEICYADGWIEKHRTPVDPTAAVKDYEIEFKDEGVSEEVIELVLQTVKAWSGQSIQVYGFRLPGSEQIRNVEDQLSGFDEVAFSKKFLEAGGHWISVYDRDFTTTDGCHLEADSARRFSAYVAHQIKK